MTEGRRRDASQRGAGAGGVNRALTRSSKGSSVGRASRNHADEETGDGGLRPKNRISSSEMPRDELIRFYGHNPPSLRHPSRRARHRGGGQAPGYRARLAGWCSPVDTETTVPGQQRQEARPKGSPPAAEGEEMSTSKVTPLVRAIGPTELAMADLRLPPGCIVCHGPTVGIGAWIPDNPGDLGCRRPGAKRFGFYRVCETHIEDVETIEAMLMDLARVPS